jgi:hypothetical protein
MPYSSDIEEDLAQQQDEEDERRAAELEEINQLERMAALESQQQQTQSAAAQMVAQRARGAASAAGKRLAQAGGRAAVAAASSTLSAIGSFLAASAVVWVPILIVIVLAIVTIFSITTICNSSVLDGPGMAAGKLAVKLLPGDACAMFKLPNINTQIPSQLTPPGQPPPSGPKLTDAQARQMLAAASITVNAAQPQTSLENMNTATVLEIVRFKRECDAWTTSPCDVMVTGGTETSGGHAGGPCSHLTGYKIDIRNTASVNRYILSPNGIFERIGSRGADALYRYSITGTTYAQEDDHWDVGGVGC